MPSVIFSHTFSAREGTAYKARDTLSKQFFSQVTYAEYAPIAKNYFSSSDTPSLRCVSARLQSGINQKHCEDNIIKTYSCYVKA